MNAKQRAARAAMEERHRPYLNWRAEVDEAILSGKATMYHFTGKRWVPQRGKFHGGGFAFTNAEEAQAFMESNGKDLRSHARFVVIYNKPRPQ